MVTRSTRNRWKHKGHSRVTVCIYWFINDLLEYTDERVRTQSGEGVFEENDVNFIINEGQIKYLIY